MSSNRAASPTLRTIAAAAGVSVMTVSLALRDHPKLPTATRERIQRLARELAYVPDPTLSRLMTHLGARRRRNLQAVIATLTTWPRGRLNRYTATLAHAAKARAAELGFGCEALEIGPYLKKPAALRRLLRNRGIEGVVLLPMERAVALEDLLDWEGVAAVSTSHSVLSPSCHLVLPDGFGGALVACRELAALGCRRIGLVLSAAMDERSRHHYTAALLWHGHYGGGERVRPLLMQPGDAAAFAAWRRTERPDAILAEVADPEAFAQWVGAPKPPRAANYRLAGISVAADGAHPGVVQGEAELGRTAVDVLAGMLQRGERGLPAAPKLTLIPGAWTPGR